jgi:hemerythrin
MFTWNDLYSVGIDLIDDQHKRLLEIGADINDIIEDHDGQDIYDEIAAKIDELEHYTVYHFDTEEKMFEEFGYADTENHIKEHRAFIEYLHSINLDNADVNQARTVNTLLKFISMWIFKHISNTDFKYREFLIEKLK